MKTTMNRRAFLSGAAALGVAAHPNMAGAAAESNAGRGSFKLPARGEFVIRGGYVMTMDPTLGDIARGDVHVKNGAIVGVGAGLKASGGAQVLDARDMIVLPGFVDTHWHMWNTLLRSMAGDKRELGYFPTVATLGKVFTPDDMYQGTRLSAVEALYQRIHLRPRLVPQHPRARVRRRELARAAGVRAPRALLLRNAASPSRDRDDRSG